MMPKRRLRPKQCPISRAEKQNLDRFGCTLRGRTGVFYIDWRGKDVAKAASAEIFARLVYVQSNVGPIVLLACEISSVRPLPHYCYFPFDLKSESHRRYLSRLTRTGEIKLCFISEKGTAERTHQLTPFLRSRAAEAYGDALQNFEKLGRSAYDFEGSMQVLERWGRTPQFLERFLTTDDLAELSRRIEEAVSVVPNEQREVARRIVREAMEAFKPYYERNRKEILESFQGIRIGLLLLLDLDRLFADNSEVFAEFFGDAIAGSSSPDDLENLNELLKIAVSLPKLSFREQAAPEPETSLTIPRIPAGLGDLVQSIAGRNIPIESMKKFLRLIGLEVGGKPGRPQKEYSREYELKISGSSWTEVTRQALVDRSELQAEFHGSDYDSLDYFDQERLRNRIRQGVIGFAKRAGKPLPSEIEGSE